MKSVKQLLTAVFVVLFSTSFSNVFGQATIQVNDPEGNALTNATIDVFRFSDRRFEKVETITSNGAGSASTELRDGTYLVCSKHYEIDGVINERFDASFYPGMAVLSIGDGKKSRATIQTARLSLEGAQIVPLNLFAHYEDGSKKKARLALVKKPSSQIIELKGNPRCSLELSFPSSAVGQRGMHTYIAAAFQSFDDNTVEVDTYFYNGDVQSSHEVIMLGTRVLNDGRNRLLIHDVKKKSGVEVPFEPMMSVRDGNRIVTSIANISFVSHETDIAVPLFTYRYVDDPSVEMSVEATVQVRDE